MSDTPRYIDSQTGETMPQLLRRTGKAPYPYPEVNELAAAYIEKLEREVNALHAQIRLMDSKPSHLLIPDGWREVIKKLRYGLGAGGRDAGMINEIALGGIILGKITDELEALEEVK